MTKNKYSTPWYAKVLGASGWIVLGGFVICMFFTCVCLVYCLINGLFSN